MVSKLKLPLLEEAAMIWSKIHGPEPLRVVSDTPYTHDVRRRIPSVEKARRILGFEAKTPVNQALDEIIPWVKQQIELGGI